MVDTDVESIARWICKQRGIDPDGNGSAVTKETLDRLGPSYKLWQYQIPFAEAILEEFIL